MRTHTYIKAAYNEYIQVINRRIRADHHHLTLKFDALNVNVSSI